MRKNVTKSFAFRVLKSHTYLDHDGSMLTEKKWEEVSCSSEGEDDKEKKDGETSEPVANPPLKKTIFKGKQSSIMGFFSKKT